MRAARTERTNIKPSTSTTAEGTLRRPACSVRAAQPGWHPGTSSLLPGSLAPSSPQEGRPTGRCLERARDLS